ncbi:hypothetical protein [Microcoleus sp. MON2_D5]|uniref:hypothetical protein n=1 Tax=Microcoleus sp. MON2_D5 TaxID=2818833 RepID=UPI002FD0BDCC
METYNISDIFIYHGYFAAAFTDGSWQVMCPQYRCIVLGKTLDARSGVAVAKARIDIWVDRVKKQQQEQG